MSIILAPRWWTHVQSCDAAWFDDAFAPSPLKKEFKGAADYIPNQVG